MERVAVSDIYPVAFLSCKGFDYKIEKEVNPVGKKRIIFVFDDRVQESLTNFYSGQEDSVSANKYARILKELKSLVHNY